MLTAAVDEVALLHRDAKCIELLRGLVGDAKEIPSRRLFPFRAGSAACNGVETYESYHAAWAAHLRLKEYNDRNDDALLVLSYRQLAACGKWKHAATLCPPQLRKPFLSALMSLILCHLLCKGTAIETKTSEEKSVRTVQMMQFIQSNNERADTIEYILATAVACHWTYYGYDPCNAKAQGEDHESTSTAAVAWFSQKMPHINDIAAVSKFKRINLLSCDRSALGKSMVEFEANNPMPSPMPTARSWDLDYIKLVHVSAAKNGTPVTSNDLAVTATLV